MGGSLIRGESRNRVLCLQIGQLPRKGIISVDREFSCSLSENNGHAVWQCKRLALPHAYALIEMLMRPSNDMSWHGLPLTCIETVVDELAVLLMFQECVNAVPYPCVYAIGRRSSLIYDRSRRRHQTPRAVDDFRRIMIR